MGKDATKCSRLGVDRSYEWFTEKPTLSDHFSANIRGEMSPSLLLSGVCFKGQMNAGKCFSKACGEIVCAMCLLLQSDFTMER